jgi:hypothetical protein
MLCRVGLIKVVPEKTTFFFAQGAMLKQFQFIRITFSGAFGHQCMFTFMFSILNNGF